MTTRPHDALFKSAFEAPADAAALLRELVPPAVRAVVAWETLDGERGSFVDAMLADHHSDLLFTAQRTTRASETIYFLLEHQSTIDPTMPLRMLTYEIRIWNRFVKEHRDAWLPPVFAVLVGHVRGGWTAARAFAELFDPDVMAISEIATLVPRFSMIVEDVEDLTQRSNDELATRSLGAFQKLALWLLRDARDPVCPLASFDFWIPSMLEISRTRSGLDRLKVLITYMFQVIDPLHLEELHAKLRALGAHTEEVAMTIAEHLHEEGRKKGREEGRKKGREEGRKKGREEGRKKGREEGRKKGREEGRKKGREEGLREGRIAMLRNLLVFKFQTLGEGYEARLQAATPEAIDRWLQRLLTVDSLPAVFED
jgi:predicted transposase YdaD